MENSLSSHSYKGTIAEAISEAKQQKKLFVVYISGDNDESKCLESTWIDPTVSGTLLKYCILLHLLEGSSEARNFSEIYPQHAIPCITVVGYNGVQLWKHEGLVSADILASNLEKAWLSLHFQETTAAFLTAALASKEQSIAETLRTSVSNQVIPEAQSSIDNPVESLKAGNSKRMETDLTIDETNTGTTSKHADDDVKTLDDGELDDSIPVAETRDIAENLSEKRKGNIDARRSDPSHLAATAIASANSEHDTKMAESIMEPSSAACNTANTESAGEVRKSDDTVSFTTKSTVALLNIRLPDGSSSQAQFSMNDTLRMVKDQIRKNDAGAIGSFDIAIPYPRKIFADQDLDRTLSELGFFSRQALILVKHNKSLHSDHQRNSINDTDAPNATGGYWASLRRMLSYVNPFSYLIRNSSPEGAPQGSQLPQRTEPSFYNTYSDEGTPQPFNNPSRPSANRQLRSRFGANIHTLKHEGENDPSNDRNTFWNGNSTQFGGNNDDGK